ncbi:serine/threonine-protein phosphatase [Actinospica sp. MGRD01-02]|uniref:Serine/threonine-protein phosphatase n=1 Tax=Actinospica acidithermotolerans TaxID=2828514 RepID=A0A941E4I9_9ACTN|nr:PP2C family protein-serine/threonine phosphatase [Actinospica acidithermotolerans]MBR7825021.1 serine/threonine-protein phosphatase [Actinospica acidithermotolerans]
MQVESGLDDPRAGIATALAASPFPVVVVDAAGVVREANAAAVDSVPGVLVDASFAQCAPEWLVRAHDAGETQAVGPVGERVLHGRVSLWPGGNTAWWLSDRTEYEALQGDLTRERESKAFLIEASNRLLASLNVEKTTATAASLAAEHLAELAIVVAPPARRGLALTCARRGGPVTTEVRRLDPAEVPGLAEALQGFPPVPSRWLDPAAAPDWLVPDGFGPVGSLVVTPLPGNGVPAGALILLRGARSGEFTEDEEAFARLFAARAGAAISAGLLFARQSTVARVLTDELVPPVLSRVDGIELAGGYRPALGDERVGGDFYDFHPPTPQDPNALIVLGDVCGKGIEAAVLTGRIRSSIAALRTVEYDHVRMLRLLNGALLSSRHTRFATMVLASVRSDGENVVARVTCAGHPPPLVVRADGAVEEVRSRGTLIGALTTVSAESSEVVLAPGETCLLYTDGITEGRGGATGREMFGTARLARVLGECSGMPAEAVLERVQMVAAQWAGSEPHDDTAVIAITAPLWPARTGEAVAEA